jgi:hypothetical protein
MFRDVRISAINYIAFHPSILPYLLFRLHDSSALVRLSCVQSLASHVPFSELSPSHRLFIINSSLNDRDKSVRDECSAMILGSWLTQCGVFFFFFLCSFFLFILYNLFIGIKRTTLRFF